jgi:hypothetical protein
VWARTFPPSESEGWTIHFIERESRYWVAAIAGQRRNELFKQGTATAWAWAKPAAFIRWFTDGERRYGKELWKLASVILKPSEIPANYGYRKLGSLPWTGNPSGTTPQVWQFGLEVAMKIKGSQGRKRVEWVNIEHPFTAISDKSDVHANHNEAQNSALRRRASACLVALFTSGNPTSARRYRRRQNLYAKKLCGLQRVLDVQRLVHNWVRSHWSLGKNQTPAMAIGYYHRPISMTELLTVQCLDFLIL